MARTNSKTAAPAAAASVEFIDTPRADSVSPDDSKIDMSALFAMCGVKLPTWKRSLVCAIASFAVGFLIGALARVVIETLVIAVAMSTGSIALCWAIYILGWIMAVYLAFAAGRAVTQYIMSGSVDKDIAAVKGKVSGWFGKFKTKAVEAA